MTRLILTFLTLLSLSVTAQFQTDKSKYATATMGVYDEDLKTDNMFTVFGVTLDLDKEQIVGYTTQAQFNPTVVFLSMDPHAARYPSWSPYACFADNPIFYIDPDGRDPREAGVKVEVDYDRFKVLNAIDMKGFGAGKTLNDPELFEDAMARETIADLFIETRFAPLGTWTKELFKLVDEDTRKWYDSIDDFKNAAHMDNYKLRENGGYPDELYSTITDRYVKNFGEGYEAEVSLKVEYNVFYSKNKKGETQRTKVKAKMTQYTLIDATNEKGEAVKKWRIFSFTYDAGSKDATSRTVETVDAVSR